MIITFVITVIFIYNFHPIGEDFLYCLEECAGVTVQIIPYILSARMIHARIFYPAGYYVLVYVLSYRSTYYPTLG